MRKSETYMGDDQDHGQFWILFVEKLDRDDGREYGGAASQPEISSIEKGEWDLL
jgi:hypothetical protein